MAKSTVYEPYQDVDKAKVIKTIWTLNDLEPKEAMMLSTLVDKDWDRTFHPNNQFTIDNQGINTAGKEWADYISQLSKMDINITVDMLVDKILSMGVEQKVNLLSLMVSMTLEQIFNMYYKKDQHG